MCIYIHTFHGKKEGSENIFHEKIPGGQAHVSRLEPTTPIRPADRNQGHYPSRHYHPQKKMAQWLTSSTHESIHTGVMGRCFHVHLAHPIHGANANSLLFPEGQPIRLVETPNPSCQWKTI